MDNNTNTNDMTPIWCNSSEIPTQVEIEALEIHGLIVTRPLTLQSSSCILETYREDFDIAA